MLATEEFNGNVLLIPEGVDGNALLIPEGFKCFAYPPKANTLEAGGKPSTKFPPERFVELLNWPSSSAKSGWVRSTLLR